MTGQLRCWVAVGVHCKLIRSVGAQAAILIYGKVEYLHGIVQLLGLVSVWRVHEGHDESLKFATQLRL